MSWFEKIMPSRIKTERRTRSVPEGLWIKCSACDAVLYRAELERNLNVCPKCSHHMRIGGRERLGHFLDEGEQVEIGAEVSPEDPLKFRDSKRYRDGWRRRRRPGVNGTRYRDRRHTRRSEDRRLCVRFKFLAAPWFSLGERFKRSVDHCIQHRAALVCFFIEWWAPACRKRCIRCCKWRDQLLARAPGQGAAAHLRAHRPDHGRCFRQSRHAG